MSWQFVFRNRLFQEFIQFVGERLQLTVSGTPWKSGMQTTGILKEETERLQRQQVIAWIRHLSGTIVPCYFTRQLEK